MYCGGEVIVAEAIQKFKASIDLKNIFELAQAAEQSANYDESYSYYTKILEVNPKSYKAWYGKAIAAGWLSTLANVRLAEVLNGIDKAIELAPKEEKPNLTIAAGDELNRIAVAIHRLAVENFKAFITLDTYNEFIFRMKLVIATYRKAATLKPDDRTIYENIINAAQQYMHRYMCWDGHTNVWPLDQTYAEAKGFISEAETEIQRIDPTFKAQVPTHKTGACYIATAVYGDECTEVATLREFRDQTLARNFGGRFFIYIYYLVGPCLGNLIGSSELASRVVRNVLDRLVVHLRRRSFH